LPFETHQRKVIGRRTANTFCSGLLPIGTGWEHRPMRRPRLSQSNGHGNRKQRYGDCFQHVQPPFFRLQRYCRSDELKINCCWPEWQPQKRAPAGRARQGSSLRLTGAQNWGVKRPAKVSHASRDLQASDRLSFLRRFPPVRIAANIAKLPDLLRKG
jgi:hypothetical protein